MFTRNLGVGVGRRFLESHRIAVMYFRILYTQYNIHACNTYAVGLCADNIMSRRCL